MPYRHLIRLFVQKGYGEIPEFYISARWLADANRNNSQPTQQSTSSQQPKIETSRYNTLCSLLNAISIDASCTLQGYNYVIDMVERERAIIGGFHLESVSSHNQGSNNPCKSENVESEVPEDMNDLTPTSFNATTQTS